MNKLADPDGDMQIDLAERQFTLTEAAFLSRVPAQSVRNWISRGQMQIGRQNRVAAHWMFSIDDLLRLTVMHDLCTRGVMAFGVLDAAKLADVVLHVARHYSAPNNPSRGHASVLVGWTESGETVAHVHPVREPGAYSPPLQVDGEYQPMRHSHVAIPATALLADLVLRTQQLATNNRKAEAPDVI